MDKRLVKSSRFLSLVLRHDPGRIGLTLDEAGWADVGELIAGAQRHGVQLSREVIREVVRNNDKKRFTLTADGNRIRARQGHSISVDLGLEAVEPPEVLYHGTATRFLDSIREQGLVRGARQHVHLSGDEATAVRVGQRHGRPAVLHVRSRAMRDAGHVFMLSENGVWLTDAVPVDFIDFPE